MKAKQPNKITNFILSLAIFVIIFGVGYKMGEYKTSSLLPQTQNASQNYLKNSDFSLFWETLNNIQQKYVDKSKIDQKKMYYDAIKGMVSSLDDPYTFFLTPDENKATKNDLQGLFEGIGAQLGLKDNRIIIVAPLKDSPAEKAGVRAGDYINAVDGQPTKSWPLTQAVSKIRGPKGTKVKLTLERDSKEFDVTIIRDQITVSSVDLKFEKNVAYLKLNQFGENTNSEWDKAVLQIQNEWKNKKIKGMVLDVRDNPGGYLESAVYLASDFLSKGDLIVKQESTNPGELRDYSAESDGRLKGIPVVVLINKGSASASEILAGALRDHKIALLIGEKSFGKGSVQEALDLSQGAGLHVTVAKWILPNGDWINGKGINPDIPVTLQIKDGNTITDDTDQQLQRAFQEILK